ncbi:MAG: DUF1761 domain-containing protein [Flavobacteriales bacterium]|nr:DUF1761 domain-containing protein [Flavobacteriales bacterium]
MDFSNVNFFAVAVATVCAFFLGFVWYSFLFGKRWMKELGFTEEELKKGANMGMIFGSTLLLTFVMALGLAMLWYAEDPAKLTWSVGLLHGLFIGICFVATSTGINYLYQRKSMVLWAIDAGYQVCFLALQGAILGAWH